MKMKRFIPILLLLLVLAACGGAETSEMDEGPVIGESMLSETFDSPDAWETYVGEGSDLRVSDGVYRIEIDDSGYIWGQNELKTEDVIIEVETNQLSDFDDNGYGIICRADAGNLGDGYYFFISGSGYAAILKGEGEGVPELSEWVATSAINKGQASNKIKAVCIGDYLALYVNDEFVMETTDSTYPSGFTALAAIATKHGNAVITFDNLNIWKATLPE